MTLEAAEVEQLISEFKPNDGDLLGALHKLQEHYGYIPVDAVPAIARRFRTTPARVYGMISFYVEFRTTPPPEVAIGWCSGPACRLKGSANMLAALEAVLGIKLGEDTPDGKIGLREAQCDGSCVAAPLLYVNGKVRGPLTVSDVIRLARELKRDGATGRGSRKKAES
ncbi:MAG: NAD(P)H-dependent oxidoreductase subunit E [Dehalococcoidia bacterium]|nr:NAD(P)H-dependent oxidoreductase subunit E [Dehalococcoidia bacterium]